MEKELLGMGLGVPEGVILKPIPGISTMYAAGDDGYIYSYSQARTNIRKPKPFRFANVRNDNYFMVTIFDKSKKTRSYSVHELINLAFHGAKPEGKHVSRHLDGDWSNNKPDNLCWGTYAENEADKKRHGRTACGERQGIAKLTDEAVRIIRASIPFGLWDSVNAAKVFGVSPITINAIARGVGWKHVK